MGICGIIPYVAWMQGLEGIGGSQLYFNCCEDSGNEEFYEMGRECA